LVQSDDSIDEFIALSCWRWSLAWSYHFTLLYPGMPCRSGAIIHYAPVENLERSDVALIDQAEHNIDIAAYVLTDWPVMQALIRAAQRGVKIRIEVSFKRAGHL
jgi:phosphatidylserine/phosphatidylglycerophosphate/cardiolipin synthase-like enzyme